MLTENGIFSRERLAGYNPELLRQSAALIVGAGALGQNTAQNLALAGIGEIRIVDKDYFEDHNRTRSPAYPLPEEREALGLSKARVVAHKINRLMTAPTPVMRYAHAWVQELGDGAFKDVGVVVACVDTPRARAYLSDKARLHGIAYIEAGFNGPDITLSCYPPATGERAVSEPCWRCSHQDLIGAFSCAFYAALADEAGVIPAIQNAAATLGGLQAEAAIIALHGEQLTSSEFAAFDLNIRTLQSRQINLSTDPMCPGIHRSLERPAIKLQTSADDSVKHLLQELGEYFNSSPIIELFHPIIWTVPCPDCGRMTSVKGGDWIWVINPRCQECKGPFPVIDDADAGNSATVHTLLSFESGSRILNATCRELELPPLSLIEASAEDGQSEFFELPGTINDLFVSGDANEQ